MEDCKDSQVRLELARQYLAATLLYWAFRLLGANERHAWHRAKHAVVDAVFDKAIEITGIADPRNREKPGMQISFEGGPADREVRHVEICGTIRLRTDDDRRHRYRRTDRRRGGSTIFEYRGLDCPVAPAE